VIFAKKFRFNFVRVLVVISACVLGGVAYFGFSYLQSVKISREIVSKPDVTTLPPDVQQELAASPTPAPQLPEKLRLPILMYHYVEYVKDKGDTIRQSLNTTPYTFERQLITLKDAGYTFLTPSDLVSALEGRSKLPQKPIILSFDDGYRDFYTDAFPLLKKYNAKAVQYVIAGFLGKPNFMYKSQVEELGKSGLVEVGAHTVHHLWLKQLNPKTVTYEVEESKKALEKILGATIHSFAYPYGAFDEQTITIVKVAGFTNAMSTIPGTEITEQNRYFLYRLRPGGRTGQQLLDYLEKAKF